MPDHYLAPGTRVRLVNHADDAWEDGIVIHCWLDADLGFHDCYVAFFGSALPDGKPAEKPYVLRYSATSLTVLT